MESRSLKVILRKEIFCVRQREQIISRVNMCERSLSENEGKGQRVAHNEGKLFLVVLWHLKRRAFAIMWQQFRAVYFQFLENLPVLL